MRAMDRSAVMIVAGALADERARRTGHAVNYTDAGITDLAEVIVAELATFNGSKGSSDTVIFKDGALGFVAENGAGGVWSQRA